MDINLKETYENLNKLRGLNLKEASYDEIKFLLFKLYKHIGIKHKIKKNRFVQRGLLLDSEMTDFFPNRIQRISFNPNGSPIGRANYEDKSVFYGCISSEIVQGYHTTGMEILPIKKDGLFQHRFIIGNWLLAEDTEFIILGGDESLNHVCKVGTDRSTAFFENAANYKETMVSLYAIDKFLCKEFSKHVEESNPWDYKISAVYCEILKENGEKGVIYPSVKSEGAGLNIVIFPEEVKRGLITFDKVLYGTFYNRNGEFTNEYVLGGISKDGIHLQWHEEYYRLHTRIKNYYIGKSDHNPLKNVEMIDLGKPINRLNIKY